MEPISLEVGSCLRAYLRQVAKTWWSILRVPNAVPGGRGALY